MEQFHKQALSIPGGVGVLGAEWDADLKWICSEDYLVKYLKDESSVKVDLPKDKRTILTVKLDVLLTDDCLEYYNTPERRKHLLAVLDTVASRGPLAVRATKEYAHYLCSKIAGGDTVECQERPAIYHQRNIDINEKK